MPRQPPKRPGPFNPPTRFTPNPRPPGASEQLILDQHLRRLVRYTRLSSLQRFLQQIADGYCVKYMASVVALLVYAAPIYFMDPAVRRGGGCFGRGVQCDDL